MALVARPLGAKVTMTTAVPEGSPGLRQPDACAAALRGKNEASESFFNILLVPGHACSSPQLILAGHRYTRSYTLQAATYTGNRQVASGHHTGPARKLVA